MKRPSMTKNQQHQRDMAHETRGALRSLKTGRPLTGNLGDADNRAREQLAKLRHEFPELARHPRPFSKLVVKPATVPNVHPMTEATVQRRQAAGKKHTTPYSYKKCDRARGEGRHNVFVLAPEEYRRRRADKAA